jgi:hypothetical protein
MSKNHNQRMRLSLPCVHEGAILDYCNTCNGTMKHVRECDLHGKATYGFVSDKVQSCNRCDKYEPDTTVESKSKQEQQIENLFNNRTPNMRREELKQRLLQKARERKEQLLKENSTPQVDHGPVSALRARRLILRKSRQEQRDNPQSSNVSAVTTAINPKSILAISKIKPDRITWACGVTTVPIRRYTTLPLTLQSLMLAGFPNPRLFVDIQGDVDIKEVLPLYNDPSFPITIRSHNIKTYGNWILALMELYIRHPHSDRYALFQDDIVMGPGVREYLEHCEYPERGYINLMTFPQNEALKHQFFPKGLPEEKCIGWYPSNQKGKSATALVFDRQIVLRILSNEELLNRPQEPKGHQNIDGGLANAMRKIGYTEYVHTPSLVRHTGTETTMGDGHPEKQPLDMSFRGENYDIMEVVRSIL